MDANRIITDIITECPLSIKHPLVLCSILISRVGEEAAKPIIEDILATYQEEVNQMKEAAAEMVDAKELEEELASVNGGTLATNKSVADPK